MCPALTWLPDPEIVTLPVPTPGGTEERTVRNPYSQWVFGRGAAFLPSTRLTKQDPSDFDYYIFLPSLTTQGHPQHTRPEFTDIKAQKRVDETIPSSDEAVGFIGLLPIRTSSVPAGETQTAPDHQPVGGLDPNRVVIVGSIDDGVNIFSDRFRPGGRPSRIEYAWMQDAPADNPSTVPFGREMTRQQITAAMNRPDADEEALMIEHGLIPAPNGPYTPCALKRRASHGTHVTDLAAGYSCDDASCETLRLITVQLPALAVADTSGASMNTAIQAAAAYVFDRAYRMSLAYGTALPVVLNLSFGLTSGARSGQAFLERALRALSAEYRKRIHEVLGQTPPAVRVLPAGNHNLSGLHSSGIRPDGRLTSTLRLQPEDQTASFAEVWLRQNTETAALSISTPDGVAHAVPLPPFSTMPPEPEKRAWLLAEPAPDGSPIPSTAIARLTIDEPASDLPEGASGIPLVWRVVLAMNPTQHHVPDRALAPFGPWRIDVYARDALGQPTDRPHSWALRDDRVPQTGFIARQPYFDDPVYVETEQDKFSDIAVDDARAGGFRMTPMARDGNMSGLATNAPLDPAAGPGDPLDSVVVGAMRWDSDAASLYSSADFNRSEASGQRDQAPHLLAPADTSRALGGILASGTLSGSKIALNGTSIATAVVTRRLSHVLRDLPPSAYAGFVPVDAAMSLGIAPERPAPGEMEIASSPPVRIERLRDGGCLLPDGPGLTGDITRGVAHK